MADIADEKRNYSNNDRISVADSQFKELPNSLLRLKED